MDSHDTVRIMAVTAGFLLYFITLCMLSLAVAEYQKEGYNMKRKFLHSGLGLLAAFALWTAAVCLVDVQPIGPMGSAVGLAAVNGFVHDLTGVHMGLYTLTDWLGLVPLAVVMGFACMGLCQWIRRKRLRLVDRDILLLGGFYLLVMAVYLFFELVIINYRPVLIDGVLEASYPSSTTLLALCVMTTARMQVRRRVSDPLLRRCLSALITVFSIFMVTARLLSGVHWFSDIVGGVLLSGGLVELYRSVNA